MPSDDAFRQFEQLVREHTGNVVLNAVLEDDDPAWNVIDSMQVQEQAGRSLPTASGSAISYTPGFEANYAIRVQRGGRMVGGKFTGNTLVMMGKDNILPTGQAADAKYPDPRKTKLPADIKIKLALKRAIGSLVKNHAQIMAELAARPVDEVAGDAMLDGAANFREFVLNYLYGDGTGALAHVNAAAPDAIPETAGGVSVTIDHGTWGRFAVGDLVVFCDSSYTKKNGNINGLCRVVAVDGRDRIIKVQAEPGEGTITIADNDYILLDETYDFDNGAVLIPEGFESLLIDSGTYPGSATPWAASGLDVDHHTSLKSFVSGTAGANDDPTMSAVTELLDMIEEHGYPPPRAWFAERGVWTLHAQIERDTHAVVQVPMGATFTAAGGVAGPVLSHMENRFQKFSSKRIGPNRLIAINPDTWIKFIPMGDRALHWVFGTGVLSGFQSIFGPVFDGTQLVELAHALFNSYIQFGCTNPKANFRRLGLKAQRNI